jgi:hypothetical protein
MPIIILYAACGLIGNGVVITTTWVLRDAERTISASHVVQFFQGEFPRTYPAEHSIFICHVSNSLKIYA